MAGAVEKLETRIGREWRGGNAGRTRKGMSAAQVEREKERAGRALDGEKCCAAG